MKKYFLNIVLLVNIIKIIYSYEIPGKINHTHENFSYSMQKDMANCTCDLSSLCDYNCPCDPKCTEEDKKKFNINEKDTLNYGKDRLADFKCENKKDKYKYNKNKAGMTVKDHLFSLLCIHFDRSGDLGEFYLENPNNENSQNIQNEWINKFFTTYENSEDNSFNYYKPDSNGNCIKSNFSKFKNYQISCISNTSTLFDQQGYTINNYGTNYIGTNQDSTQNKKQIFYYNSETRNSDFKVTWGINNENQNQNRPKGYIQGGPIKIKLDDNTQYDQYYLPIIDINGNCITDNINDTVSIKPILFKANTTYSCIYDNSNNNINNTFIYQFLYKRNRLCHSPIDCENIKYDCSPPTLTGNQNTIFTLNIYTSKEGKEHEPYEIIKGYKCYATESNSNENQKILTLKINFIDISSSSYYNTKNGKITSLNPLNEEVMDAIKIIED